MEKSSKNNRGIYTAMKILFFGSDYPPTGGGISTYTHEWLYAIAQEKDVESKARVFGNKKPRIEYINNKLEINIVKSVNFFYVGWIIVVDIMKNRGFETIHSFNLFPVGFWVVFWSKIFNRKSVITFYGADACDSRTSKKVFFLQKWSLVHSDTAITISQFTKNKVIERYGLYKKNIEVIYPILPTFDKNISSRNIQEVQEKYGLKVDDFIVIAVCRLVKRKGIEYLIEASKMINDPKIKVMIVGDGKERTFLENKVKNDGLEGKVFFTGKVPALAPYYCVSDVAVLVSYIIENEGDFEGLGLVLLEAQSYGLPVIGTRSGGIPEALEDLKTGFIVPERDAKSIAEAILKLKNDKKTYTSMSEQTKSFLPNKFGLENTVRRYILLINKN